MTQLSLLTEPPQEQPFKVNYNNTSELNTAAIDFSTVLGQVTAVSLLQGAIAQSRIGQAYLFTGPAGVGKALSARIFLAQAFDIHNINNHPDILWVEPTYLHQGQLLSESKAVENELKHKVAPQIRIEQVREISQFLATSPLVATIKVVVIESAHHMNSSAANALLKTLEEPTGKSTIILLSSQPGKLLPTILSRCQIVPFRRLNNESLEYVLQKLGRQEVLDSPTIRSLAAGSPGQAITHYEQLRSISDSVLEALAAPPTDALTAIQITKEIDTTLEYQQQMWLLDYLQQKWWQCFSNIEWMQKLASARDAMSKKASSRLIWEVLLLPKL